MGQKIRKRRAPQQFSFLVSAEKNAVSRYIVDSDFFIIRPKTVLIDPKRS